MVKVFGIILVLAAVTLFFKLTPLGQETYIAWAGQDSEKLSLKLKKELLAEISNTKREKLWLPAGEVLIERLGSTANKRLSEDFSPFEIQLESKKRIEITILDLQDQSRPGIIFQMSLIDLTSKNKVDELGYTYYYKVKQP
jgi:hypothetical protein